ncbi:MAG TPA: hypothetical protein VFW79_03850 [Cellulomonas sp.]|uniref:hypothetical protein n=1 Tax=Cellulomonas sp. TaxID=40001 RepID=UPI002E3301AF|nr:hypothetical protein [Cellulomonas sp.]HEX5331755.1 hypothetical protein [Cellulomonas sp.]
MEPDDQTMSERLESDKLHEREREPGHAHPVTEVDETMAERIESDQIDEPSDVTIRTGTGRHVQNAVEAEESLAERMESDQIDE